jgi:hypothetical protein
MLGYLASYTIICPRVRRSSDRFLLSAHNHMAVFFFAVDRIVNYLKKVRLLVGPNPVSTLQHPFSFHFLSSCACTDPDDSSIMIYRATASLLVTLVVVFTSVVNAKNESKKRHLISEKIGYVRRVNPNQLAEASSKMDAILTKLSAGSSDRMQATEQMDESYSYTPSSKLPKTSARQSLDYEYQQDRKLGKKGKKSSVDFGSDFGSNSGSEGSFGSSSGDPYGDDVFDADRDEGAVNGTGIIISNATDFNVTESPSAAPSSSPSGAPSASPSAAPSASPSAAPTILVTSEPTFSPTLNATFVNLDDDLFNATDDFLRANETDDDAWNTTVTTSILIKAASDNSTCVMYNNSFLEVVDCDVAGDLGLWEIIASEDPSLMNLRHMASGLCVPENPEFPDSTFDCWIKEGNQAIADTINGLVDCSSSFAAFVGFTDAGNPTLLYNAICSTGEVGADSDVILLSYTPEDGSTILLWGEKILLELTKGGPYELNAGFYFEEL